MQTVDLKTILVVDDEPHLRLLFRETLEDEGYVVVEADGANAAFTALERQPIDLAILDIRMRGTHGLELLSGLHAAYPQLPVIMCSGVDSLFDDYSVWDAGEQVVGLFSKPVKLAELIECVNRALGAASPSVSP